MNDLMNDFYNLSLDDTNGCVKSLTDYFQNMDMRDTNDINKLEDMFNDLGLHNDKQLANKFYAFIVILRHKIPCSVAISWPTCRSTKCN